MDRMKVDNLYRHGFQLYEEQIATYLKEHYSGISKIEFSLIFKSGGGEGFVYARIIPVVYDSYGNKVYLRNDGVLDMAVPDYGTLAGLDLSFNVNDGSEIIYLYNEKNESVEVGQYQHLPEHLKLKTYKSTDAIITAYSQKGSLKGVEKNSQGSPNAEIVYNLEIRRIDERELDKWK
ncbi:hypothetical protein MK514_05515 [Streptococcus gordonii]|uniref:hypothetical protein n=1 Tax=Streptococcus gordonii TaxID=1302 RepID=UPI000AA8C4C3|nr:hypothetical protein [Streptococcus gordonii]MCY7130278.1 hypothetical protein [Streptococcus gordonii]MCY7141102.1 hypothetical protein [Streptococcus gordonii]RSJ29143.1 hypothetical protein D8823_07860 [Streptococcus gordonii]